MIRFLEEENMLYVYTPYSSEFIRKAKQLKGKWSSVKKAWYFEISNKEYVLSLLRDIFGYDGINNVEMADIIIKLDKLQIDVPSEKILCLFGRDIITKQYRDSIPKLGDGVYVVEGEFLNRSGSVNHPTIGCVDGISLKINSVPRNFVTYYINEYGEEAIDIKTKDINKEMLLIEKELITKRLIEIEKLLQE